MADKRLTPWLRRHLVWSCATN